MQSRLLFITAVNQLIFFRHFARFHLKMSNLQCVSSRLLCMGCILVYPQVKTYQCRAFCNNYSTTKPSMVKQHVSLCLQAPGLGASLLLLCARVLFRQALTKLTPTYIYFIYIHIYMYIYVCFLCWLELDSSIALYNVEQF